MLNENKGNEMIEILKHFHQHVPEEETEKEFIVQVNKDMSKSVLSIDTNL